MDSGRETKSVRTRNLSERHPRAIIATADDHVLHPRVPEPLQLLASAEDRNATEVAAVTRLIHIVKKAHNLVLPAQTHNVGHHERMARRAPHNYLVPLCHSTPSAGSTHHNI